MYKYKIHLLHFSVAVEELQGSCAWGSIVDPHGEPKSVI
jgi:hypothetical protein